MEISTRFFLHHPNKETQQKLENLINQWSTTDVCEPENFQAHLLKEAKNIAPSLNTEEIVERFLTTLKEENYTAWELQPESTGPVASYYYFRYTHGSNGLELVEAILQFMVDLVPDLDIRACLQGDDEPWERFYRSEEGIIRSTDYEPDFDEIEDDEFPYEYEWWHEGLPIEIKAGFINSWKQTE